MTRELLQKYLDNNCTPQEQAEVLSWLKQEVASGKDKEFIYADWQSITPEATTGNEERLGMLLDKIHHQINIKPQSTTYRKNILTTSLTWITRVAAILLIPTLVYLFYTQFPLQQNYLFAEADTLEFVAPSGSRAFIQLSDGTEIHLDYGSSIKYPKTFRGKTREVTLSGEGFFNVSHNPKMPFIVKTNSMDIKVLGTKFNVVAYPEKETTTATLVEGKVVLQQTNKQGITTTLKSMTPGEHVSYNKETGNISSEIGDVRKYVAWKDGVLVFDNTNIADITERLGRMYNVEFEIADDIKDYTYTVTFIDEQLIQILDYMTMATPIKYKIIPRQQLPDGTLSKQKIIVEKNKSLNTKQRK